MGLQHSVRAAAVGSERIRTNHHTGWPATPAVVCASGRGPKRADEWLSHRDRWHAALTGSRNSSISYTSCRCDFPNSAIPITPFLKARPALAFTTSSAVVNDAGTVAAVVAVVSCCSGRLLLPLLLDALLCLLHPLPVLQQQALALLWRHPWFWLINRGVRS